MVPRVAFLLKAEIVITYTTIAAKEISQYIRSNKNDDLG